ncbi:hypothetical protein BDW74DRAFT_176116 [Aspergillus multicolor]|uniref:uncharacterized protein n=1 Tax=Aspergillus multicolor TaxID=41759 RepID=UPI003CCD02AD
MNLPHASCLWLLAAYLGVLPVVHAVSVVEVDLVFPRNDTYSPTEAFPVVWAIQNSAKAQLLNPSVSYGINSWANTSVTFNATQPFELYEANLSSTDPYLFYRFHEALTPGKWWLTWHLAYQSCDVEALTDQYIFSDAGVFSHVFGWSRMFTISKSTSTPDKEVDLVAATANDSCPDDGNAVAINVTDTTMKSPERLNYAHRDTCVVTTNSTSGTPVHTPNPCGVTISPQMAASISANLNWRRCSAVDAPDDCPPENAARPFIVLVEVGDVLSTYQFGESKKITGAKRILSFGGWEFSNSDATYKIFRTGVRPENRLTMATNIANFIKDNDLDGVDIDWEYPGAPDLPRTILNLLPGKSMSIAAPSSYWYLKQFPIAQLSKILDYIVYMTYDLHSQWDAHNSNAQEGCEPGNCLRSQINLTETKQSLAMITKAGVPGEKVIVGVTSYGRSFKMASPGCWGPDCQFTGDRLTSNALKGECTDTAGYLADAEIADIMADSSRVVTSFIDSSSNSDILVYDNDEWVGYMSAATKKTRISLYTAFHTVPPPETKWANFIEKANSGSDPKTGHSRNGSGTATGPTSIDYTPSERWRAVNADAAWKDVVRIWKDTDRPRIGVNFTQSVFSTLQIGDQTNCGLLTQDSCDTINCLSPLDRELSGPAGQFIWNSTAAIHKLFADYDEYLWKAATELSLQIDHLTNKFAPLPEEDDSLWQDLLTNLLVLGGVGTAGPLMRKFLSQMPWVTQNSRGETTESVAMAVLEQGILVGRRLVGEDGFWTPEKQDEFSAYMGEATKVNGNVEYYVGGQDVIDIINDAIAKFGNSDGKIWAKGLMNCNGNNHSQVVEWGIY